MTDSTKLTLGQRAALEYDKLLDKLKIHDGDDNELDIEVSGTLNVQGSAVLTTDDLGEGGEISANATTLDNYDSTAFARKAEDVTVTGNWNFGVTPKVNGTDIATITDIPDEFGDGGDADTLAGISASNYGVLGQNETVTGEWAFDGNVSFDGIPSLPGVQRRIEIGSGTGPHSIRFGTDPQTDGSDGHIVMDTNPNEIRIEDDIGTPLFTIPMDGSRPSIQNDDIHTTADNLDSGTADATQLGGYAASAYPRKGEDTTISGDWILDNVTINQFRTNPIETEPDRGRVSRSFVTREPMTLYVDPTGSNSNDGTQANPVKDIQEAFSRVPYLIEHDVYIYVADGTYTDGLDADTLMSMNHWLGNGSNEAEFRLIGNTDNPSQCVIDHGCNITAHGKQEHCIVEGFEFNDLAQANGDVQFSDCIFNGNLTAGFGTKAGNLFFARCEFDPDGTSEVGLTVNGTAQIGIKGGGFGSHANGSIRTNEGAFISVSAQTTIPEGTIGTDGTGAHIDGKTGDCVILDDRIYFAGNEFAPSGGGGTGNADTLDGFDSTQFLRSDIDDTMGGNLTIDSGNTTLQIGGINSSGPHDIAFGAQTGEPNVHIVSRAADDTLNFELDKDTAQQVLKIPTDGSIPQIYGETILTTADENPFLRTDQDDTTSGVLTLASQSAITHGPASNGEALRLTSSWSDYHFDMSFGQGRYAHGYNWYFDGTDYRFRNGNDYANKISTNTNANTLTISVSDAEATTADEILTWTDFDFNTSGVLSVPSDVTVGGSSVITEASDIDATTINGHEITVSATAPSNPSENDLWVDTSGA